MMRSFRTYRLLRFLVASSLVLAVTLPLVRYVCAKGTLPASEMAGLSMLEGRTGQAAAHAACQGETATARGESCAMQHAAPCPEDGPCDAAPCGAHAELSPSCCAIEAEHSDAKSILESKSLLARVILPVVAILALPEPATRTVHPLLAHDPHADDGGGVSLRVLHASFLL